MAMISLTQKAKYALKALVYLAKQHEQSRGPVLITKIAESEGISRKFFGAYLVGA